MDEVVRGGGRIEKDGQTRHLYACVQSRDSIYTPDKLKTRSSTIKKMNTQDFLINDNDNNNKKKRNKSCHCKIEGETVKKRTQCCDSTKIKPKKFSSKIIKSASFFHNFFNNFNFNQCEQVENSESEENKNKVIKYGLSFILNLLTLPINFKSISWSSSTTVNLWKFSIISTLVISSFLTAHAQDAGDKSSGQRCYICLPGNRNSTEALDILSIFPKEALDIPDCAGFGSHNAHQFELTCPPSYTGCLRTTLISSSTSNAYILVARSCAKLALDDCKVANLVEYCYCSSPLCNGEKTMPGQNLSSNSTRRIPNNNNNRRIGVNSAHGKSTSTNNSNNNHNINEDDTHGFWREGETDDEDLLNSNRNHNFNQNVDGHAGQDGGEADLEGSGDFEEDDRSKTSDNEASSSSPDKTHQHRGQFKGGNIPASSNKGKILNAGVSSSSSSTVSQSWSLIAILALVISLNFCRFTTKQLCL